VILISECLRWSELLRSQGLGKKVERVGGGVCNAGAHVMAGELLLK
jgi:hypothetical protein